MVPEVIGPNIIPIKMAMHAIGMDDKKPYSRHGKLYYKPYRNYYCTGVNDIIWTALERVGYAWHDDVDGDSITNYHLTQDGIDWLGDAIGVTIYYS